VCVCVCVCVCVAFLGGARVCEWQFTPFCVRALGLLCLAVFSLVGCFNSSNA
jgi:hypothetical protein